LDGFLPALIAFNHKRPEIRQASQRTQIDPVQGGGIFDHVVPDADRFLGEYPGDTGFDDLKYHPDTSQNN